jgi:subtilisin family serine protease
VQWLRGRRRLPIALGVVCVVLWGVVAVVLLGRDGDGDPAGSGDDLAVEVLGAEVLDRLHQAEPSPDCVSDPTAPPADEDLVALDVLWLEGTCLQTRTEYMAEGDVDARRRELAEDPDVVVAGVSPPVFLDGPTPVPPSVEAPRGLDAPSPARRPAQDGDDRRDDQWALDALTPENPSDPPWPDGDGAVVAVLDTGIDAAHGDLADAVIGRRHYPGEDQAVLDDDGHGTHVAGIVAARQGNGGIVGVAPAASILDVPVELHRPDRVLNRGADPWTGLVWAVNSGATVANLSFGGSPEAYEEDGSLALAVAATEYARHNDVVVVAAAGNCGPEPEDAFDDDQIGDDGLLEGCDEANERQMPAMLNDLVVAVGAVMEDDDELPIAGYSSRNEDVDLVAPGYRNVSTYPAGKGGDEDEVDGQVRAYLTIGATSQATPHVAGAVAVAQSVFPAATRNQVVQALLDGADPAKLPEDDRSDPGAGHGFLQIDRLVSELQDAITPDAGDLADSTQAAFVREGMLYAFDGTRAHPVRPVDQSAPVEWLQWSDEHDRLVGYAGGTLFSWSGPGTDVVEVPYEPSCGGCELSLDYLDDAGQPTRERPGDVVVSVDYDGTLTQYDAATLEELGDTTLPFPDDAPGTKTVYADVGGRLLVHESGGAQASERLWLVDPASGDVAEPRDVTGMVQGDVAVSASQDRIALVAGYSPCSDANTVYVVDGEDLGDVAEPAMPPGLTVDELFFNGDALYATMTHLPAGDGPRCAEEQSGSAGIWRLDGDTWEQVRDRGLLDARPLEGRAGDQPTGWLVVESDGQGSLRPSPSGDVSLGDLGGMEGELWSTPTRDEVDLDPEGGGAPGSGVPGEGGGGEGDGDGGGGDDDGDDDGGGAPASVAAAVARFEEFVHALGAGDVDTACAIGRPAIEAGGGGMTCEQAVPVLVDMSPESELAALREAEVDPSAAQQTAPDRVEIAPAYPYSSEPETDPPVILEHDGDDWFVVQ